MLFDINLMRPDTTPTTAAKKAKDAKDSPRWIEVDPLELAERFGERVAIVIFEGGEKEETATREAVRMIRKLYRVYRHPE